MFSAGETQTVGSTTPSVTPAPVDNSLTSITDSLSQLTTDARNSMYGQAGAAVFNAIGQIWTQANSATIMREQYDTQGRIADMNILNARNEIANQTETMRIVATLSGQSGDARVDRAQAEADLRIAETELAERKNVQKATHVDVRSLPFYGRPNRT